MAEIEYIHLCDSAFVMEGGKPCLIGIFDKLTAASLPAAHPAMALAMRVRGQVHEKLTLRIELVRPDGAVLMAMNVKVKIGPDGSTFVHVNMTQTQFPDAGRYAFNVLFDGRFVASHPLVVQSSPDPDLLRQEPFHRGQFH